MKTRSFVLFVAACAGSALLSLVAVAQTEQRPPTDQLLPETTVLYLQVRNFPEFVEDMQDSAMGRMMQDEEIAPLVDELWAQAREGWERLSSEQGLDMAWDDITKLAHGEICFAVIAPRRADTQFAFFLDIDEEAGAADRLLERARTMGENEGASFEEEETEDARFMTVNSPDGNVFTMFRKQGTVVVTTNRDLSQQILDRWSGRPVEKIRPFNENRKFVTIMNRCRGSKQELPELRFFVDPIEMAKSLTRGQAGAAVALGFLPVLGLDGLLAIGGTSVMGEGDFQNVNRMHFLLSNPRAGIIEMLALKPGQYEPGQWVPADSSNMLMTSWDASRMVSELQKMVDFFGGEGTFDRQFTDIVKREVDLDLREDILAALNGSVTWLTWVERPLTINSQVNGVGLGLADTEKAEQVLRKIMERINRDAGDGEDERLVEDTYEGVTLWRFDNTRLRNRFETAREEGRMQMTLRAPEPAFAIVGDTLILSDSAAFVRMAIDTERGKQARLVDLPEFKTVSERMRKLLRGDLPAGIAFSQPAIALEQFYELGRSEETMNFLRNAAEENDAPFLGGIQRAIEDHPLPPFDSLRKYFMPQGAYILSDDTGYHIMQFEMRSRESSN